jgi:hypothetical protein
MSDFAQRGKGVLRSTIGAHPVTAALVLGALVLLVLILAYALVHYKAACGPAAQNKRGHFASAAARTPHNRRWDPAAEAEAQALASMGNLGRAPQGERNLQGAIDAATDATTAFTDEHLTQLMHNGRIE